MRDALCFVERDELVPAELDEMLGIEEPGSTDTSRLRATDNGIPPLSADSNLHRVEIVSNLQWSTTPNPSPVELIQGSYNLGQNIPNYSSATDEFRFTPGYTIPPWLGPLTGTGGVTLPWNGAQTVADSFDNSPGIAVDVRRSGGAWVSSQPFGVTVTQPSPETDYWYPIPELTFIEGVPSRISLLPYRKQTTGISRYTGGYSPESGAGAGYGYWQHIEGIYLDCTTVDMVYDGTAQRPAYPQVSSDYFVGMERAADNVFGAWTTETKLFPVGPSGHRGQFPPTPPASGGGFPSSGGKHLNVRAVWATLCLGPILNRKIQKLPRTRSCA